MASVRINIFDLTSLNSIFRCCKVGVYHTSIVIDNRNEYYYGFAAAGYTGIDSPDEIDRIPASMTGTLYKQVELGTSQLEYSECQTKIQQLIESPLWLSESYNMLYHNCNDFTLEVSQILFGEEHVQKHYPFWVQRGITIGKWIFSTSLSYVVHANNFQFDFFSSNFDKYQKQENRKKSQKIKSEIKETSIL